MLRLWLTASLLLALSWASIPAFAEAVAGHPGWKLEKTKNEQTPEENGVIEYADFFALYPNDPRPPITIDGNTANRILQGQITPESVYYDRTVGAAEKAAKAQSESNGGAVGWQMAESTYVPLDVENAAAKNKNASNSSNLPSSNGAGAAAAFAGANSFSGGNVRAGSAAGGYAGGGSGLGAGYSGSTNPGSVGAGYDYVNANASAAAGAAAAAAAASAGGYSGGAAGTLGSTAGGGRTATTASGTGVYTGETSPSGANLTYSQMIDQAMGSASQSLCGRMGQYASGGQCK